MAEATAGLFRALSDPARVKILNLLTRRDEPVCACEFEPALGLSQPTVSHHLKKLTEVGLLEREQRGIRGGPLVLVASAVVPEVSSWTAPVGSAR